MSATTSSGASSASDSSVTDGDTSFKFANKTLQDYEVISVIGNGTFGTCFKVRDKQTGELYAWKGIDYDELSESKKASLVSEIRVLRQLQHPNIVEYYHHLVNHEAKSIFIVMECCEGGDLAQLIKRARDERKRFEERYIWRVLFQVCKALQVCHNKIRKGTILHRDIKPANIFLDAQGNAKLGDFGLARMLRKNQDFAATFVGTPYYMSPEIVRGSRYDRKSDVWAVGCLAYEMCALRTPFQAAKFDELTLNISNGKFNHIPAVYSTDLQEIIAYMLSVDSEQRPSIEVITRHPTVVRNITELGNEFPTLIKAESDLFEVDEIATARCKLQYSPSIDLSSTMYTEHNSFNEEYGQRRLSVVFTPDLRTELFSSATGHLKPKCIFQRSDPELYESIQQELYTSVHNLTPLRPPVPPPKPTSHARTSANISVDELKSPTLISEDVFNEALQARLHAIRAHESLLEHKEHCLNMRTQELNEREKRLQQLESVLHKRELELLAQEKTLAADVLQAAARRNDNACSPSPPPIPPRKSSVSKHDETYCSIEDTQLESPTIAKLNLPLTKSYPALRRVTFQSPQKFTNYSIDANANDGAQAQKLAAGKVNAKRQPTELQASVSSKDSHESIDSGIAANSTSTTLTTTTATMPTRRRSILSTLFGKHRSSKDTTKSGSSHIKNNVANNKVNQQPIASSPTPKVRMPFAPRPDQVIAKCETSELSNIWTKEHKRAAFDLLAAMNAGQCGTIDATQSNMVQYNGSSAHAATNNMTIGRQKLRQSTRERHSATLRRHNHMRRSLMIPHQSLAHVTAASAGAVATTTRSGVGSREKMLL
ncbi:PREDICTED: serine/threonine-protein kinase dst1 [Bactrocera latifrons]|uniref:serine/threonine-protein kinase dst1 n=1 Tax=Bactrocera latifrons TaxID=174628 RepID=UPI0008DE179E|nr:PREDICTED: serine/threonine-protein kinase dst1 [Bactrocera latifrons]